MAVQIECVDLVKRYGKTAVLDGLNWTVAAGGVVGLLGGSGVGKTTLLRLIAGLDRCSAGKVTITTTASAGTSRRPRVGMVFQNLALWPHLSARKHIECVLGRLPRRERRRRADAVLAETRVPPAAWDRRPAELSGGEAQRLALARALAPEPELLLLDEPLAQIDATLRVEMLELLREVIRARGMTTVYVTHHWREAMKLCERIAVIDGGRIVMEGTPEEVFWNPPSPQLARLTGPVVELPEQWLDDGLITCTEEPPSAGPGVGEETGLLVVRPQQVHLIEPAGANRWQLAECRPEGAGWRLVLVLQDRRLSVASMAPTAPGQTVGIALKGAASLPLRN